MTVTSMIMTQPVVDMTNFTDLSTHYPPVHSTEGSTSFIQHLLSNTTTNNTSTPLEPGVIEASDNILALVGNSVVAIAVIVNNILLLLTLARTPRLWSATNAYLASMAGADLLVGIVLVVRGFWLMEATAWPFNAYKYLCMPFVSLLYVSALESYTCVLLVSLDRFVYIIYPFWYQRNVSRRRTAVCIAISWMFASALGFLPLVLNEFTPQKGCSPMVIVSCQYLLFCLLIYLFSIELLVAILYGRIFCVGSQQRRKVQSTQANVGKLKSHLNENSGVLGNSSESNLYNELGSGYSNALGNVRSTDTGSRKGFGRFYRSNEISAKQQNIEIYDETIIFKNKNSVRLVKAADAEDSLENVPKSKKKYIKDSQRNVSDQQGLAFKSTNTKTLSRLAQKASKLKDKQIRRAAVAKAAMSERRNSPSNDSGSSRWQTIRFLLLVCGIFFTFYIPLELVVILYFTLGVPEIAVTIAVSFAGINSALNLYVAVAMNKTFKRALGESLRCCCCKRSNLGEDGFPAPRRRDVDFVSDYEYRPRPQVLTPVHTRIDTLPVVAGSPSRELGRSGNTNNNTAGSVRETSGHNKNVSVFVVEL